jgi:hypothetical protein
MPILPEVWATQQVPRQPELQETLEEWGQRDMGVSLERREREFAHAHKSYGHINQTENSTFLLVFKIQNTKNLNDLIMG